MFKLLTFFALACCWALAQAQLPSNTDPNTWISLQRSLLELQKNYEVQIGPNAEFGKRLAALIETVNSYIAEASRPTVSPGSPVTRPPGVSESQVLDVLLGAFADMKKLFPQTGAVGTAVDNLIIKTQEIKAIADAPQVLYICVPTRNVVFSG